MGGGHLPTLTAAASSLVPEPRTAQAQSQCKSAPWTAPRTLIAAKVSQLSNKPPTLHQPHLILTSDIWPQRLVVLLEQIVQNERGILLVRPGDQHLIDSGVLMIFVVVAIFP